MLTLQDLWKSSQNTRIEDDIKDEDTKVLLLGIDKNNSWKFGYGMERTRI